MLSKRVDHYVIEVYDPHICKWVYYTGYRTLRTLKKKYSNVVETLKNYDTPFASRVRLVSRDYDRQVVKVICSYSK